MGMFGLRGPWFYSNMVSIGSVNRTTGTWFREMLASDDDMEKFYKFKINCVPMYLLTNNIPLRDREILHKLYCSIKMQRKSTNAVAFIAAVMLLAKIQLPSFQRLWKLFPLAIIFLGIRLGINLYLAQYNSPMLLALLNKYKDKASSDLYAIKDEKLSLIHI